MKLVTWFSLLAGSAVLLAGCSSDPATPGDDDLQKQLGAAAAENKGKVDTKSSRSRGELPAEVKDKMGAPPAAGGATAGAAPAAPDATGK